MEDPHIEGAFRHTFKHPYHAVKILTTFHSCLASLFTTDRPTSLQVPRYPLLEKLLSFLEEKNHNPVSAGYFCAVLSAVVKGFRTRLWRYVRTYKEHFKRLVDHAHLEPFPLLIAELMRTDANEVGMPMKEYEELAEEFASSPSGGWEVIGHLVSFGTPVEYLSSERFVLRMLNGIFDKREHSSSGLRILTTMIEKIQASKLPSEGSGSSGQSENCPALNILKGACHYLNFFRAALQDGSAVYWDHKLPMVKFLNAIVQLRDGDFNKRLLTDGFVVELLNFFEQYPNCTILHANVYKILNSLFVPDYIEVLETVLDRDSVPERLREMFAKGQGGFDFGNNKVLNSSYTAHVASLSWEVTKLAKDSDKLAELLEHKYKWKAFAIIVQAHHEFQDTANKVDLQLESPRSFNDIATRIRMQLKRELEEDAAEHKDSGDELGREEGKERASRPRTEHAAKRRKGDEGEKSGSGGDVGAADLDK